MSITKSRRTKFTAAHLTPETKEALEKTAREQNKSVSAVVSEAVEEKLCHCKDGVTSGCPVHGVADVVK